MDKARVNTVLELLREGFPGHRGRKGKVGGSMPKSMTGWLFKPAKGAQKASSKPTAEKKLPAPIITMRPAHSVGPGKPYSKAEQGVGSLDVAAGKSGRVTGASFSNFLVKNLGGKSRSSGSYRTLQLPEKDRGKAEKLLKSIGFEFASTESRPGESQRTKVFRHKQTGIRVSTAIFRGETLLSFSSADITGKMKSPKGS